MVIVIIVLFSLVLSSVSFASDEDYRNSVASKMGKKLGRGIVNILTGWIEIPKNIAAEWRKTDPFTGFIVGGIEGIGWGWVRTVTGVYDTVTFLFPIPKDYEPLMEPEYILPDMWGEPLPMMDGMDIPQDNDIRRY